MSANWLKVIPASPDYLPGETALASDLLASFFPRARETRCETTPEAIFVDQGQNWERVICPACAAELDSQWWSQAMRAAHQTGFVDLLVRLPCCESMSSLNDLQYEMPAGFARAVLRVCSPGRDIDDPGLEALEGTLGCKLRKIWARY